MPRVPSPARSATWSTARSVRLEEASGELDPLLRDPAARADADLGPESAAEGAHAHCCVVRHVREGERTVEVAERPGPRRRRRRMRQLRHRVIDVLRLSTIAVRRHDA